MTDFWLFTSLLFVCTFQSLYNLSIGWKMGTYSTIQTKPSGRPWVPLVNNLQMTYLKGSILQGKAHQAFSFKSDG